jgi:hypothetical protein
MSFELDRKVRKWFKIACVNIRSSSKNRVAACPLHRSAAGVQKVEISGGKSYKVE